MCSACGGITGADLIKIPNQSQNLGEKNAGKKVSDMVEADASVNWTGTKGKAVGTAKYNADFSALYSGAEKSGHFFPIEFDSRYYDKPVTLSGRTGGDKEVTPSSSDPYLITRIENLSDGKTLTAKVDQNEIFSVDFSDVTLESAINVLPQDTSLEGFNKTVKELIDENVKISANGEVTGKLKSIQGFTEFSSVVSEQSGHYLPVKIDKQYLGKEVSVTGRSTTKVTVKQETDLYFILRVASTSTTFKFKDGNNEFMKLTFKNATLE